MVSIRADIDEWLMEDNSIPEKLDKLRSNRALANKVTVLYNIFTELAIAYNSRIVNQRLCNEIWFPIIPKYWGRLKFYVYDCRRNGEPIGHNFEQLVKRIEAYNSRMGHTFSDPLADRLNRLPMEAT